MRAPGVLPVIPDDTIDAPFGMDAQTEALVDETDLSVVWVVDGQELPFEDAEPTHRPWLEESKEWARGVDRAKRGDSEDSPDVVWV